MIHSHNLKNLTEKIIQKDVWWDMLYKFIEVLQINIFIVDTHGHVILPPDENKYGGRLISDHSLRLGLFKNSAVCLNQFDHHDLYLEIKNRYALHCFAIPINYAAATTFAYAIVGPVILNRRLPAESYLSAARDVNADEEALMDEIHNIRVVSHVMIHSIIDLLERMLKDHVDLTLRLINEGMSGAGHPETEQPLFPESKAAYDLDSTVRLDELLVTMLDVALKMTHAEVGSIMMKDNSTGKLQLKVFRGLDNTTIENLQEKDKEGIASIAVKENACFLIRGQEADNRIKHLLKRPHIKEALVMPLTVNDHTFGTLNLHSTQHQVDFKQSLDNLQHLSHLLSMAF